MPRILFFLFSFSVLGAYAQCPYPASVSGAHGYCVGDTLFAHSSHALANIVWYENGIPVNYVKGTHKLQDTVTLFEKPITPLPTYSSISADEEGNVYVSNFQDNDVEMWAPGATGPVIVAGGNGSGSAANQLNGPSYLFVDAQKNVYVVDGNNNRVQKWAPGATSGVTVAGGNGLGNALNQFNRLGGIYVDCDGGIYTADQNAQIRYWAPGATSGTVVVDGSGTAMGTPYGIWLDGANNVYECDASNVIMRWKIGTNTGTVVAGVRTNNAGYGPYLDHPGAIWVDNFGNFYVADADRLSYWPTGAATGTTLLNGPATADFTVNGVYVDGKGNIYVLDDTWPDAKERIQEIKNITTIDTTYVPSEPGYYNAVVIDVNGYSSTTPTINVGTPNPVPPSVSITATDSNLFICQAATFTAVAANAGGTPSYQWEESGVPVGTGSASFTGDVFGNGDLVYCIMTASNGCALVADTSNKIRLSVDPLGHASVAVTASQNPVCAGTPIDFTAVFSNTTANPALDWFVNGVDTHFGGSVFSADTFAGGDVVYCEIVSDASCGLGRSNSIPVGLLEPPTVDSGQVFNIHYGTSLQLDPTVSGDVAQYIWSPAAGLSSTSIPDPTASPSVTTLYTLTVVSPAGCTDSGHILVDVYTPLSVPGGFTPNNDGINDVFYILAGPYGSTIDEFSVFNQWGQQVFEVHGVEPGNPAYGWNGYFHGVPAPTGTYVYFARMKLPGGQVQAYKGTVELMR